MSNSYLVVSLFPCSYHKLMVAKYCSKQEKFQEAKWRSTVEQRPVCKLERVMDVDLFKEIQGSMGWGQPSLSSNIAWNVLPCCLRRMERGGMNRPPGPCQQHMPQLNLEVGVPAIELVGTETSREELIELYLEVYKLHRLPGSPLGELAVAEEVLAAFPDWLQRREEAPQAQAQPSPGDSHPSRSRKPHWEWESSVDRSLTRMHEVHWKALSTMTALEEEIERLSQMMAHSQSRVRLRSWDHRRSIGKREEERMLPG